MKIDNIFNKKLDSYTESELQQAVDAIIEILNNRGLNPINLRERVLTSQGIDCPHCNGPNCILHEKTKRLRYKCQDCKKTFTSTYGTPIHGIHSVKKWQQFIPLFMQSKSLRYIAKELKISTRTAFDWRHKTLASLSENTWMSSMHGIVEIDDRQFDYNQKGSRSLNREAYKRTADRKNRGKFSEKITALVMHERISNKTEMKIVQKGRIRKTTLDKALKSKVSLVKTIVCSDMHRSFTGWAAENHLPCEPIKASAKQFKNGIYHLQNINNNNNQFKKWYSRFYGVASKYLNNYLSWHNLLMAIKKHKNQIAKALTIILTPSTALHRYYNIKSDFEKLLIPHVFTT